MFPRKDDSSGKKVSKLYVEPAELARKLIKELEGTKVSQGGQTWVRDQYTVFLCREDFARFRSHLDQLVRKLESHMEKHVQNRRYATSGAMTVELTMDPDLKPGYFGVLAEKAEYESAAPRGGAQAPQGRSIWDVPEDDDLDDDYVTGRPQGAGARGGQRVGPSVPPMPGAPIAGAPPVGGAPPLPGTSPVMAPSYGQPSSADQGGARASMPPQMPQQPPAVPQVPPQMPQQPPAVPKMPPQMPQVPPVVPTAPPIPAMPPVAAAARPAPAAQAPVAPAAEPLVLKVNGQERVYSQGKAVIGRSREADLQIDNPDVSRKHAVIYWSEGSIIVKDLGSTNGTMVNGYPVDSTVVRSSDVIRIGNVHITAVSK